MKYLFILVFIAYQSILFGGNGTILGVGVNYIQNGSSKSKFISKTDPFTEIYIDAGTSLSLDVWRDGGSNSPYSYWVYNQQTSYYSEVSAGGANKLFNIPNGHQIGRWTAGVDDDNFDFRIYEFIPSPVAEFIGNPTSGGAPLTVQFTNQSTGNITGYSWNFGDGDTSTQQNPSHKYQIVGPFTVSLTVTGPGGSDTEIKPNYIDIMTGIESLEFISGIPDDYRLENNYPNPFNPQTSIEFGIPEESINALKVYNITGEEIAVLLSNEVLPAGRFNYQFNAKELPSGIYIYLLTSSSTYSDNNFNSVKKMILLK